ncbi:hypothetical protein O181_060728 [Austropuccinia psidii MF-1]|uniref:Uncharacterized protein n=1 Tax=Austropuccinia psidii MF-1 TaxID=1389203 RepID=A0A9Q3EGY4_9BASI|nr:hypothetical protein [Austropuccinia psidii MF-1]
MYHHSAHAMAGSQGDDQSVEKEGNNESWKIFEAIGEDLFQRPMAEITPISQHLQDVLTGKDPFDQIPKSQEDDQYYEDPLECKNICGRPQGAKNKNKNQKKENLQDLKLLKVNPREEEDPPQK